MTFEFDSRNVLRVGGVALCAAVFVRINRELQWRLYNATNIVWKTRYYATEREAKEACESIARLWFATLLRDAGYIDGE